MLFESAIAVSSGSAAATGRFQQNRRRSYAVSCNRWLAGVRSAPAPQNAGDRVSLSDMEHVARAVKPFKLCSRY
jgi:hypothetical protein